MKALTADKLYRFANATLFFAHCQLVLEQVRHKCCQDLTAIEIDAALKGLDEAYENLKSARAMLLVALEKEPLDP